MKRLYFPVATAILLALTLFSFSDNLLTNVGQRSNSNPMLVIHGLFCLAWMILLCVQANLIRTRRIALHRSLGIAGMGIAIGVTISTLYVFWARWNGWDAMEPVMQANRLLLPSYSALVLLAFLWRRHPDWHRRLIFVASLYMMEPVLSRAFDPFNPILDLFTEEAVETAWWIFFVVTWNGLFLSLFVYDRKVARRIHPVTIAGYAWFWAVWAFVWLV